MLFYSNEERPFIYSHDETLFYTLTSHPLPYLLPFLSPLTLPITSHLLPLPLILPFLLPLPVLLSFFLPFLSPLTLPITSHLLPFLLPLPQHPTTCPVTLEDLDALLSSAKATMFQDPDVLLNAQNLRSKVLELEDVCVRTLPMITTASQEHMTEVIIAR